MNIFEDNLFDTEEKRADAIMQFEVLESSRGWQLVVAIVQANIEVLKKQLLEGTENETKEDIDRIRDKIKDHENFINTPQNQIKAFSEGESATAPSSDPY